jgi:hypothetical protein
MITSEQRTKITNLITNWDTRKNYGLITDLKLSLRTAIAPAILINDTEIVALVAEKNNAIERGFSSL